MMASIFPNSQFQRDKADKANDFVENGPLGEEIKTHALQRCERFFQYLVTMKIVIDEINSINAAANSQTRYKYDQFLEVKATDQIGTGIRSDDVSYNQFSSFNSNNINQQPTTQFGRRDAAHFCNLGLAAGFDAIVLSAKSDFVKDCYEKLKVYCGDTKEMPQKVNIGPDKKIDVIHGRLAKSMLMDGKKIFSKVRLREYVKEIKDEFVDYMADKSKKNDPIAACAQCYLDMYRNGTRRKSFAEAVYDTIYPEIEGLCLASNHHKQRAHEYYDH